jgi:hypothetical protein
MKPLISLARQLLGKGLVTLGKLLALVPRAQLVLWGAGLLLLAACWFANQAHRRQAVDLKQVQQQTATMVSTLQAQAATALRDANERNVQAVQELEAKRGKLEHEASELAARLQSLQASERAQAAQIAALPPTLLARRVTAELAAQDSGPAENVESRNPKPETRNSDRVSDDGFRVSLSSPQLRNLAAALVERDACREQKQVVGEQFANCRAQVDANAAIIQQQVDSLAKLNQAVSAKDEILARRETQQQAELTAARGSRLSRLARAVEWVALGIVVGAVVR